MIIQDPCFGLVDVGPALPIVLWQGERPIPNWVLGLQDWMLRISCIATDRSGSDGFSQRSQAVSLFTALRFFGYGHFDEVGFQSREQVSFAKVVFVLEFQRILHFQAGHLAGKQGLLGESWDRNKGAPRIYL